MQKFKSNSLHAILSLAFIIALIGQFAGVVYLLRDEDVMSATLFIPASLVTYSISKLVKSFNRYGQ